MIKHALTSIDGVGIWGSAAVLLFFLVFVSVIVRLMLFSRSEIELLSNLPLDETAAAPVKEI